MSTQKIFISSVQSEFEAERRALKDYLCSDPLLRRFFDTFIFEDIPADDRRVDEVYLEEVAKSDIYIGLFGDLYGSEDQDGISPTHREFTEASRLGITRLVYVKATAPDARHPKMQELVAVAESQLVRRRFGSFAELRGAVYASLVKYLENMELIRTGPFDASACRNATKEDLSEENIAAFVKQARLARGFPLSENSDSSEILIHLNLLDQDRPTNAAILLFAKQPQRFLISSEVKCAHFHGTEVAKPIPSYHVYKGDVFALVDQALDFVMSKIDLRVGTRKDSPQAPVEYEIPREVVSEAIVNAIAHRDYTSNGSVQVMLFADRLEVWNPGTLPASLTLEQLRLPHGSVPANPLLAEPLYLTQYIERMGTGTRDMITRCRDAGLPEPDFRITDGFTTVIYRKTAATGQVTEQVTSQEGTKLAPSWHQVEILRKCLEESAISELMAIDGRSDRTKFRNQVLNPLLEAGLVEMTIPDKPRSSKQKYRLTEGGKQALKGECSCR